MRLWVLMLLIAVLSISGCPEHAYPTCGYCAVQMFDAENKKDVRICDELKHSGLLENKDANLPVSTCKDICYKRIALLTKDISICDRLQEPLNYKGECYRMVGIASNDASICDAINDGPNQKRCYYDIAINTRNFSLCDKISGDDLANCYGWGLLQNVCKTNCYSVLTKKLNKTG